MPDAPPSEPGFRPSRQHVAGRGPGWGFLGEIGSVRAAAVIIVLMLLGSLLGMFYETAYGREAAHLFVYGSAWFLAVIFMLAACIFAAAAVRYPWQRRQYGFVVVHLGLLVLIAGFVVAGRDRLDGVLECPPGAEASELTLDSDRIRLGDTTSVREVQLDTLRHAGFPALPRYALAVALPYRLPEINRLATPLPLTDHNQAALRLTAVCLGAGSERDRVPAAKGEPAVGFAVLMPGQQAPERMSSWLTPREGAKHLSLALTSLGETSAPQLVADLADRTPVAAAVLRVYHAGAAHSVDLADLPQAVDLGEGRSLRVESLFDASKEPGERIGERPQVPSVRVALIGADGSRRERAVIGVLAPRRDHDWPELFLRHPALETPDPKAPQSGIVMAVADAAGALHVRALTGRRGIGAIFTVADGATRVEPLAEGVPMQLAVRWLARSESRWSEPRPFPMAVPARVRAQRWIEVEVERGGQRVRRWLPRGHEIVVDPGDGKAPVLVGYQHDRRDLREEFGFAVRLHSFEEGKDPGARSTASYVSQVDIVRSGRDDERHTIDMNRPLTVDGVTLYQSSFTPPDAAGNQSSIFQAAQDRGRFLKYFGSALLVGGIILMYLLRRRA